MTTAAGTVTCLQEIRCCCVVAATTPARSQRNVKASGGIFPDDLILNSRTAVPWFQD
jgi:hypothetical protein